MCEYVGNVYNVKCLLHDNHMNKMRYVELHIAIEIDFYERLVKVNGTRSALGSKYVENPSLILFVQCMLRFLKIVNSR
jgi:hypothetical protein